MRNYVLVNSGSAVTAKDLKGMVFPANFLLYNKCKITDLNCLREINVLI